MTLNEEYYSIAHFSKFVRPGSYRISIAIPPALSSLGAVAFKNPDGSKVMIISNYGTSTTSFSVKQEEKNFSYSVPAKSVATVFW